MFLIYNEGTKEPFKGKPKPYHELDATKYYLTHFSNVLYLKFIANNKAATSLERQQANREIPIADRKMAHWAKHPNYDHKVVLKECERLKKQWQT
jgi:hypothetical protein